MFDNIVKVAWPEGEERNMVLLEDISFTDSKNKKWTARKGESINGASIPGVFWQVIGPPYIGHYRRASVIHDVYCGRKTESWADTHKVFNEMMLFDGVSDIRRIHMFKAVWYFGPKWGKKDNRYTIYSYTLSNFLTDPISLIKLLDELECPQ